VAQYTVKSAFVNKVKGAKADGRPLEIGARVTPGAKFESPDEEQISRLIAARCLEDPEGRGKAGAAGREATTAPGGPEALEQPAPTIENLSPLSPPDPAKVGGRGGRGGGNGPKSVEGGREGRGRRAKATD
jgi:hypothetical protein